MFNEPRIAAAMRAMMTDIEPPALPLDSIRRRIGFARQRDLGRSFFAYAAAAAAAVVLALPRLAPGLTQTIEQRFEAIAHWTPPPPAPASVESAMRSQSGTLAAAQARANFTIVPPAGLPKDAAFERIVTAPTGVYSNLTHRWSVGSPAVWFIYKRTGGRELSLLADRFDPREGAPATHIYLEGERDGREILIRHDRFTWRNGNQVMSAVADETISAAEIARIRAAMHGVAVTGVDAQAQIVRQYRLP